MTSEDRVTFDPGFDNTADDHCRDCVPHDVPAGTTVVCEHLDHHHELGGKGPRHVVVSAGGQSPARPDLGARP